MNKKRYAGLMWTEKDKYDYMDTKGLETVRRDNCALVREVIQTSLDKIIIERNVPSAINYVKSQIADLVSVCVLYAVYYGPKGAKYVLAVISIFISATKQNGYLTAGDYKEPEQGCRVCARPWWEGRGLQDETGSCGACR